MDIPAATMVAAVSAYEAWQEDHIFGEYTPAAPYAIRELVMSLAQIVWAASNSRSGEETSRSDGNAP